MIGSVTVRASKQVSSSAIFNIARTPPASSINKLISLQYIHKIVTSYSAFHTEYVTIYTKGLAATVS